jgi:hypothetical protein
MKLAPMAKEGVPQDQGHQHDRGHQVQAAYEGFATVVLLCSKAVKRAGLPLKTRIDRRPQRTGDG